MSMFNKSLSELCPYTYMAFLVCLSDQTNLGQAVMTVGMMTEKDMMKQMMQVKRRNHSHSDNMLN